MAKKITEAKAASVLDDAALARMRAEATAKSSPFIDPALYREAENLMHLAKDEWLSEVLGRPVKVPTWRFFSNADLALSVAAVKADRAYLEALRAEWWAERDRTARAKAEAADASRQAEWDEWVALRERLPVPVVVEHNWTARHLDGYEQGADHIVVTKDLHVGLLHRTAHSPLCWTPSRAHQLRHVGHAFSDDERRVPNCKACLRHAERLSAKEADR